MSVRRITVVRRTQERTDVPTQPALFCEAVRLPDTPDDPTYHVPGQDYEEYAEAYNDVAEWCSATLSEGVDSSDVYYYYLDTNDFFASDGWWVVQEGHTEFSAYTDPTFHELFMKLDK